MLPFHYYTYTWDPVLQGILKVWNTEIPWTTGEFQRNPQNHLEPRPVWTLKDLEGPLIYALTQGVMIFDDILDLQSSKNVQWIPISQK